MVDGMTQLAAHLVVTDPLHDAFWGERTGQFLDPSGHRRALGRHIRDVPAEEIARQAAALVDGSVNS
jgi:PhnB protein